MKLVNKKFLNSLKFLPIFVIAILGAYIVFMVSDPLQVTPNTFSTPLPITKTPPTAIKIDRINKTLPVSAAIVEGNEWQLYSDKVAWLSTSAIAGEGNVILYAHNTWNLFGQLYKLRVGDEIQIQQDNKWISYKVKQYRRVTPSDVNAILSDKNQLTLYTCEGSFDQKRLVVYADLVDQIN